MSNVPEMIKNMSGNRSLILGGQVISEQQTKINFLDRTLAKETLGDLFGQKWMGGPFLLVASILGRRKDQKIDNLIKSCMLPTTETQS